MATSTSNGRVAEPPADAAPNGGATPEDLRLALRAATRTIADSFRAAGGYPKAADEVFALKKARGVA